MRKLVKLNTHLTPYQKIRRDLKRAEREVSKVLDIPYSLLHTMHREWLAFLLNLYETYGPLYKDHINDHIPDYRSYGKMLR